MTPLLRISGLSSHYKWYLIAGPQNTEIIWTDIKIMYYKVTKHWIAQKKKKNKWKWKTEIIWIQLVNFP
jgi:hypothetical protein